MKNAWEIVDKGIALGASDIHITVAIPPIFRVNGALVMDDSEPISVEDARRISLEIIPNAQFKEILDRNGQVEFSSAIPEIGRFRVNLYMQRGSYAAAIRIIPMDVPQLKSLGMPEVIKKIADLEEGLVIVTGVAGNGKSTTMAAILDHINQTKQFNVLTIEDPIEYLHGHGRCMINQREVGKDTSSYAQGLKSALRQDPDVIMVSDMSDADTIATAITAAETGHLVLASLHSRSAVQAIFRVIDIFPSAQRQQIVIQLSTSLQAVICQQLLPKLNENGRIPAVEILLTNPKIREMIRQGEVTGLLEVIENSPESGMISMDQSLKALYTAGEISRTEASKRMLRHKLQ